MGKARQVIHYAPTEVKAKSINSLREKDHLHFCSTRDCRKVYTDNCRNLDVNGRCHDCRGVRRPIWISARDPQPCCIGNCTQVVDIKRLIKYTLAGPGPWYQCQACARTHGWPCS